MSEGYEKIRLPDGSEADAYPVSFQTGSEEWNEYVTDDGTVIRIKLVVMGFKRVVDRWAPDGQPMYLAQLGNVMVVSAPDDQKRANTI